MKHLLVGAAVTPMLMMLSSVPTSAQDAVSTADAAVKETTTEVIVTGRIRFRDRTSAENPTLVYKQDYFQRFEPVSVGEMLKRVPGVTFTSDMLEYDGVSMRGLPPGYTKILINGRRAPGGESDRSFFVDRIPAELVDRIEIIRSPAADQSSEGMAGALNVILKEGAQLNGGIAKIGALINGEDGEVRPSAALAYAGGDEVTSWWVGANYQGRRNPKKKFSWRYDDEAGTEIKDTEAQDDTRDGTDISLNGELTRRFDTGFFRVAAFVVDTNRDEDETSLTFEEGTDFDGAEIQAERIKQNTYSLKGDGEFALAAGKIQYGLGWNQYKEDTVASVFVTGEEDLSDQELDEYVTLDIEDSEFSADLAYVYKTDSFRLKAGVDLLNKTRDGAEVEWDIEDGVLEEPDPAPGAIYSIEEKRVDPFVRLTFTPTPKLTIDAGLRYETTDRDVTSDDGTISDKSEDLNPSLHLTYRASPVDQFRLSYARTIRRADYDFLKPYTANEEPTDDDDLRGNPLLKNEKANGIDAGYERRIGDRGIFGVNLFYRDIEDVIEVVGTGEPSEAELEDEEDEINGQIYEPRNIGSGKTWGVELDFSSPLDSLGLPDTGVFFNYTWMDSEVTDPFTSEKRAFANQPGYVYNIGFIHTLKQLNASFGASLYDRDQGVAYAFDEIATVDYEPSLEAFFEKRIGARWVARFSAHNLLDASKDETFFKYDGLRTTADFDEYEVETEKSGVLYQLTLRTTF